MFWSLFQDAYWEVGQNAGPKMDITHPHLLSYIVLVHLIVDLQVLVSIGKFRPGGGYA